MSLLKRAACSANLQLKLLQQIALLESFEAKINTRKPKKANKGKLPSNRVARRAKKPRRV